MTVSKISWEFCQQNSDDILADGLEKLRSSQEHVVGWRSPNLAGNYVFSLSNRPLYIGEAGNLTQRLSQQYRPKTSTVLKNYDKQKNEFDIDQNLLIEDFVVQCMDTCIGRKELEEFGIVNLPAPLNKFQLGKRNVYLDQPTSGLWTEVQNQYPGLIAEGFETVFASEAIRWKDATPFATPGLYVISDSNEVIYIGESSDVGSRYRTHGRDTYFSAFRRNLGTKQFGYQLKERKGKKRYFGDEENAQIDSFVQGCKIIMKPISFGRYELEEHMIRLLQPALNKKSR